MKPQTHETPVNRDAALFLTRKRHVIDLQEALNKFACAVCSPVTVEEVRKMCRERIGGDDQKTVIITLRLRADSQHPNKVAAIMETKVAKQLGLETYSNLDI